MRSFLETKLAGARLRPALALGIALGVVAGPAVCRAAVPTFEEVKAKFTRSEARLYDRHGELIHERRSDLRGRRLEWTPLGESSPALRQAVLASEDRRFLEHGGVDWLALAGAAREQLLGSGRRGASTISMQLASFLDDELKPRRVKRDWWQKAAQLREALELERHWSKEQILEAYLNFVSFRGELQGVASAARGLFGKAPSGLDQEESLLLAALIRSPQAEESTVIRRACALARELQQEEACTNLTRLVKERGLLPRPFPPEVALAPHVAQWLVKSGDAGSTLDRRIQAKVIEVLRRQVLSLRGRNVRDAAALVVENATGRVLAYVGSVGDLSSAHAVDGVRAPRQAGSTLKPFLYGLALERRLLTAASLVDDTVTDLPLGGGMVYRPRDFDREYHGDDVTVRLALASSLNVPAVRTLQLVGVGRLVERLGALGFTGLREEEFYGPSLALGSAEVTLWDLVNAYRALANQGQWSELSVVPGPGPAGGSDGAGARRAPRRVMPAGVAFIIGDILADKGGRSLSFGLDSPLALRFWAAAKTGTSKDMRDNWCVGWSSRYTVGVWAGNFSGESMWNVSGISGAAPAWAEMMEILHQVGHGPAPRPPREVVRAGDEWYLRGTEPGSGAGPMLAAESPRPAQPPRILYPVEGLMIARDPDIPDERERVIFRARVARGDGRWVLNGRELATRGEQLAWPVGEPGDYELRLLSAEGSVLDQVRFVVRR